MKLLLCGLGNMGSNHLRVLGELKDLGRLAAVVEPNAARARAVAASHKVHAFGCVRDALKESSFDAAVVATATASHDEVAMPLLEMGIPLLVEKPLARNTRRAEKLMKASEKRGVPLMVGHVERFNPAVVATKQLIRSGTLGEIISINVRRVGGTPRDVLGAGDVLVDLAVHDIDIVSWVLGDVPRFAGALGHRGKKVIDSASLLFQCKGAAVDLHMNWVTPVKIRSMAVTGSKGYLEANLMTQQVFVSRKDPLLTSRKQQRVNFFEAYASSFSAPNRTEIGITRQEPLKAELTAFLQAVATDRKMPVTAEEGYRALVLAEEARRMVERRRPKP